MRFSSSSLLLGRKSLRFFSGGALRAETPPELAHAGQADDEDECGAGQSGHHQGDNGRHMPRRREEVDLDRPRILGQEVDQRDAEHHADEECAPSKANPDGLSA